ncbi:MULTISPECIES: carbohydrate ABC transporter permease [unclassified Pseudofrankia]|uniref:carbohydrate ABC transporter permease n=1 Tax=unclassified Pseudofrankia TaxID=2994372 RepID=UPI0009F40243|nr:MULTISPECIES: sugar ABC transporter permease [unclassified Pseudofrankia]MDT3438673.1 sugar ABC transporter permease [Pseudofrankia sp. BMG5.37]
MTRRAGAGPRTGAGGWRIGALLFPALLGLTVFILGPALVSAFAAGTDKTLTGPSFHWVGTANLREAFGDPDFGRSVRNTLLYCVLTVIPAVVVGLALALAAQKVTRGSGALRLALFLPVSANLVAIAVVFAYMFDPSGHGLANTVIGWFGAGPRNWLGDEATSLPVVALVGGWRLTSFVFVVYLAGLTTIPASVYEAAEVDGIRGFARLRHVTLPLLAPTTIFLAVFTTILTLQTFETVAVLTHGGPFRSSATIVYYIYEVGFTGSFRIGYASAIALLLILGIVLIGVLGSVLGRRARARAARVESDGADAGVDGAAGAALVGLGVAGAAAPATEAAR